MRRLSMCICLLASALVLTPAAASADGRGDVVVIAILDDALNPYHWDFRGDRMPQHLDEDPGNDLPLHLPPDTWVPGFPDPEVFGDYRALNLTKPGYADLLEEARAADQGEWNSVAPSGPTRQNYYWLPDTKVIGALNFGGGSIAGPVGAHGGGTTSVSVGNFYGSCPECVLVFIQYASAASGERAIEWAMSQPWIDVISNSYGFSRVARDRIYAGSDVGAQRTAIERGQTVLFSAGNGNDGSFVVPNTTYYSSQEGPDWIVTVGAVNGSGYGYSGSGKPADVSSVGGGYPSSYGASTGIGRGNGFGGTSNATPVIAGTYSRALYLARTALSGASKTQSGGAIATGDPISCGAARPGCELGDGVLTAAELRRLLFLGAAPATGGLAPAGVGPVPRVGEEMTLSTGYGAYFGRMHGDDAWMSEFENALRAPLFGDGPLRARPQGEAEHMIVDSFCRQHLWGSWDLGAYRAGDTPLPGPDPLFPVRSAMEASCPHLPAPF